MTSELTEDIASGRVFFNTASTAEDRICSGPMKLISTDSGTDFPGRKPGICTSYKIIIIKTKDRNSIYQRGIGYIFKVGLTSPTKNWHFQCKEPLFKV